MQNLRFNIAAGETKVFVMAGRYLEIIEAANPITLGLYDSNGSQTDDATNVLSGTYMEGAYSQFEVFSSTAQVVELFMTNTRGGTRRQPGTVQVIDGERAKVLQGICFRGVDSQTGNQPAVQLWNPAASGKNLFLQAVRAGAASADTWGIQTTPTQLGTAGNVAANLDRTGPAGVGLIRKGLATDAASPQGIATGYVAASVDNIVLMPRPVLIRPGFGVLIYAGAAANTIRACFEWEEWPV